MIPYLYSCATSTKAIRYQANGGIKKVRTFNEDYGGRDDGFFKNA
jgi:hypothetical protein